MSKMVSHDPFGNFEHKLWPKERLGVKLAIRLLTTKSWESPWFPYMQVVWHILLERSQQVLQLSSKPHLNRRFSRKVMGPQSCNNPSFGNFEIPTWEFQDSHLGVLGQNDIWVLVSWLGIKYTIKGKVMVSPKFGLWWILWVRVCLWLVHAPKCYNYTLFNLLFGLCRSMWVIELFVNFLNPILELQHALLPVKCCELGNAPQLLFLSLSSILDLKLNSSRNLGVCQNLLHHNNVGFTFVGITNFEVKRVISKPLYYVAMPHSMVIVTKAPFTIALAHTIVGMKFRP